MRTGTTLATCCFSLCLLAQEADSVVVVPGSTVTDTTEITWRDRHSPKRAVLFSAIIPGAGQIYNRKYWKVPIVWAGLGVGYYFVQTNRTQYKRFKAAYIAVVDGDPTTIDEFNGEVSSGQLLSVTNTYRRWMELSYIGMGLVYILNVMDAAVDAHFVRFDISPDLTMDLRPAWGLAAQGAVGFSLGLQL